MLACIQKFLVGVGRFTSPKNRQGLEVTGLTFVDWNGPRSFEAAR